MINPIYFPLHIFGLHFGASNAPTRPHPAKVTILGQVGHDYKVQFGNDITCDGLLLRVMSRQCCPASSIILAIHIALGGVVPLGTNQNHVYNVLITMRGKVQIEKKQWIEAWAHLTEFSRSNKVLYKRRSLIYMTT